MSRPRWTTPGLVPGDVAAPPDAFGPAIPRAAPPRIGRELGTAGGRRAVFVLRGGIVVAAWEASGGCQGRGASVWVDVHATRASCTARPRRAPSMCFRPSDREMPSRPTLRMKRPGALWSDPHAVRRTLPRPGVLPNPCRRKREGHPKVAQVLDENWRARDGSNVRPLPSEGRLSATSPAVPRPLYSIQPGGTVPRLSRAGSSIFDRARAALHLSAPDRQEDSRARCAQAPRMSAALRLDRTP